MGRIFSPGKLLLTSEYTVLDGALALAVPTQPGQEFFFDEIQNGKSLVFWEAFHQDKLWLKAVIDYKNGEVLETNSGEPAEFILKVLLKAAELSSVKFTDRESYRLKTNLQFPADFGLGSSSTLMNNLADWAGIDAFLLNELTLGGSGYDIAIAKEKSPLLFQLKEGKRISNPVHFKPTFAEDLIFIHLNQKQNSREGIALYRSKEKAPGLIEFFSELTVKATKTSDPDSFSNLMALHEDTLSEFLGLKTAKERHFSDCPAFIKSLGAWGGDFVMSRQFPGYRAYFAERGFPTVFTWNDLIA